MATSAGIKTRLLLFSDTHGLDRLPDSVLRQHADVAIHCGDLTTESKLDEYRASIRLLQAMSAPLKLVLAGNHDSTLDIPIYGYNGEARKLFTDATGITFLDEGTHFFRLQNGASLSVYASPYTPSLGDWGFQYHPDQGHSFSIHNIDVAITHGPPKGIMDLTHLGERAGCPYVFEAIARARPRMHCFGHIHEAWGAKLVTWRHKISQNPSHLSDIDNGKSVIIGRLSNVRNYVEFATTSHCPGDPSMLEWCSQTLFVNASIDGTQMLPIQPPWFVDLELSPASRLSSEASSSSTTS